MLTIAQKRARFVELHAAPGCFVIPNPFDIGSAKYLASLGFPALASTSAGMAFAAGKGDGAIDRAYTLSHLRELAETTDLPLNADFESGFASDADGVHESVRLCVSAGVSGLSIEDYTGDSDAPLYSVSEAVDRLRAARAAINGQRREGPAHSAQRGDPSSGWRPCRGAAAPSPVRGSRRRRALCALGADAG